MTDQQATIGVGAASHVDALEKRVTALEQFQRNTEIQEAERKVEWRHLDSRLNELDRKIEKVSGVLIKLNWLMVTGIVGGLVAWVISGGIRLG